MPNDLRFDGRVAVVTGAGQGLGRSHALLLGARGAKVVVNDLGGSAHGSGQSTSAADKVVAEIKAAGGEAVANYDSVENGDKIVKTALDTWGRIDIVVNNAGILRDTSFQKLTQEDWDLVYRVHVLGAFKVTHAAWNVMRDAGYGRIIFTSSAAGIYGNFGQPNYAMAKLGLVGLSNTLAIEGKKKGVLVNTIAPIAGSRLTETVLPKDLVDALKPEYVSSLVAWLCHETSEETGGLFEVGGGFFAKLRWERTEGKSFRLGRDITPEMLQKDWPAITDFGKSTHPPDITASMQPVLGNIGTKSKGGNEFIDVDQALGFEFPPTTSKYDERDLALYALGIGAANDPLDTQELQYVYEMNPDGFQVLPTFGVIPAINTILDQAKQGKQAPGLNYGFERILHGEQYTEVKRPLPSSAKLTHKTRIKDIFDKGKGALVIIETRSFDDSGEELIVNDITMFVRGAGGWGGDRGPSADINVPPDRAPDAVITEKTHENQALIFRLSGDWNPLHADPGFAKNFGFERPILHGMCTYGYAGRHVIKAFSKNDARYFKSIKARFAESVFPGETLVTEMWKESDTRIVFRCTIKERNKVAISNAAVELYKEIPSERAKTVSAPAKSAAAPAASNAGSPSDDVFWGIRWHIEQNPGLAAQIATVFQFKLTGPDKVWTVDLKNGNGSVTEGAGVKPDCTLELSNEDWLGMASGSLNPQKLYFGGKLKISGNVMASQKLEFLKTIDAAKVKAALAAAGRGGGAAPSPSAAAPAAAAPSGASSDKITSADVFAVIGDYIAKNPDLVGQTATVFQFKLTGPDSQWAIDLKNGKGSVTAGNADKPDCTLELSDEDFQAMTSGKADAQKLYFAGKLKISGNVMASQKLMFLKKIDPKQAADVIANSRKSAAPAATSAPAAAKANTGAQTPALFKSLADRLTKTPALAKDFDAVLQFKIKDPDSAWIVDLKSGKPSVTEGVAKDAAATFVLSEENLAELTKGQSAREMFQQGKLRVDGNVRLAHFLEKLSVES